MVSLKLRADGVAEKQGSTGRAIEISFPLDVLRRSRAGRTPQGWSQTDSRVSVMGR